jgi:acyl-coenzyme A synthetase/AMP-(fatty) acid ligase
VTINLYIRNHATLSGESPALAFGNQMLTYSSLASRTNQMARCLVKQGLTKGERIGVLMPNCMENVIVFLSTLKIGCIEVNFSTATPIHTVIKAFKKVGITALVCAGVRSESVARVIEAVPGLKAFMAEGKTLSSLPGSNRLDIEDIYKETMDEIDLGPTDSDLAMIQYTSGTTGDPKGVMLNQRSFIVASRSRYQLLGLDNKTPVVNCLDLSHSCSKSLLFDAFIHGALLVVTNGFVPPLKFINTLIKQRVGIITGPPNLFQYLVKMKSQPHLVEQLGTCLRFMEIGMSGPSLKLITRLREVFPWAAIINRYGVTEYAGAAATMLHAPNLPLHRIGSCGPGFPGAQLDIVNGAQRESGKNAAGRIRIKGISMMMGYWEDRHDPKRTDYAAHGFITDDIAEADGEKHIYLRGRDSDIMKVSGEKIAPQDIESIILQVAGVTEAAVFGIEDEVLGEKIVAVYSSQLEISRHDVEKHCRQTLPSIMVPACFAGITHEIPKNKMGKISKKHLKNLFLANGLKPLQAEVVH